MDVTSNLICLSFYVVILLAFLCVGGLITNLVESRYQRRQRKAAKIQTWNCDMKGLR